MKIMKGLVLGACAGLGGPLGAQDMAAGGELYADACRSCHGPRAQGMASFPRLNEFDANYLVMRLEQYRAGERVGPNSALMQPNATDLTDDDIANLAAFIATEF
jgi:cytochrome c553